MRDRVARTLAEQGYEDEGGPDGPAEDTDGTGEASHATDGPETPGEEEATAAPDSGTEDTDGTGGDTSESSADEQPDGDASDEPAQDDVSEGSTGQSAEDGSAEHASDETPTDEEPSADATPGEGDEISGEQGREADEAVEQEQDTEPAGTVEPDGGTTSDEAVAAVASDEDVDTTATVDTSSAAVGAGAVAAAAAAAGTGASADSEADSAPEPEDPGAEDTDGTADPQGPEEQAADDQTPGKTAQQDAADAPADDGPEAAGSETSAASPATEEIPVQVPKDDDGPEAETGDAGKAPAEDGGPSSAEPSAEEATQTFSVADYDEATDADSSATAVFPTWRRGAGAADSGRDDAEPTEGPGKLWDSTSSAAWGSTGAAWGSGIVAGAASQGEAAKAWDNWGDDADSDRNQPQEQDREQSEQDQGQDRAVQPPEEPSSAETFEEKTSDPWDKDDFAAAVFSAWNSSGSTTAAGDRDEDTDGPGDTDGPRATESFAGAAPPSTAPFPAPAPGTDPDDLDSADSTDTAGDGGSDDKDATGEDAAGGDGVKTSLWPSPQRYSEYSEEPEGEESAAESAGAEDGTQEAAERDREGSLAAGTAVGAAAAAGAATAAAASSVKDADGQKTDTDSADPAGTAEGPATAKGAGAKGKGKKEKKPRPLWWRILRPVLICAAVFLVLGIGGFAYLYTTVEMPDAAKAEATDQGSTFYFADGETQFAERGTNRDPVSYEEMTASGDQVVEAMISAEDRGFWSEPGVSVSGTSRAVWSTVTGQQVQGGSTITQQMVRNYYEGVSREQSVGRKIQEIIISIKVDRSETKEWVMEQYLNTIYFGRQAYGIQAAAEVYYHKDVDELTPEESAFLAAAIQQPHYFGEADVMESTDALERRWQYVIDGMVTTGAISEQEAAEMEFPVPEAERPADGTDVSGYKGYMLQEAMNELERLGFTEDMIQRHGYEIVTTFDQDMMEAAHEAVEETVPHDSIPEGVNLGLTTVDPATGEVLAFYGGHDYLENQYDTSFHGAAQAGSAFKPYVLATALEEGYSLNSSVDGRGPRDVHGSRVQNAGNDPGGVMNLTQATRVSNNLGFIELAEQVGYENIRDTAYAAGLPEGSIDDNQLVPVMPLGAISVRPVDQASGFGTFVNEGQHMEPHVVKEVINTNGEDERPEVESTQALEESTAADITHALEEAVSSGTGTAARLSGHPTAGKTGTTDGSVAAWFVGYTPQLSTAVGVYSGDNESFSIPGHNISGGGLPATLWNNYMSRAMEGYEAGSFPAPAHGGTTENWAPEQPTQQPQEDPQEPQEPQEPPVEEEPPPPPEEEPPPEEDPGEEPPDDDPGEEPPGDDDGPGIPDPPEQGDQMARSED